jgi:hypothetical protein
MDDLEPSAQPSMCKGYSTMTIVQRSNYVDYALLARQLAQMLVLSSRFGESLLG